jgi:hypothetical protein
MENTVKVTGIFVLGITTRSTEWSIYALTKNFEKLNSNLN